MKLFVQIFCLGALCMLATQVKAQQSINAASNQVILNGQHFEYAIGEMTLVNTAQTGNLIVTQGFFQPKERKAKGQDGSQSLKDLASLLKVYPNPTQNILFIESMMDEPANLEFQIIDASGKVIMDNKMSKSLSNSKTSFDLEALSAGNYFLMIRQSKFASPSNEHLTYKIQKVN